MANNAELKKIVDSMGKAIDAAASRLGLVDGASIAAKLELAIFMMYLAESDGEISLEEASIISEVCDLDLTSKILHNYMIDENVNSPEFEQKVPVSLQIMVEADNKYLKQHPDAEISDGSLIILKAYQLVANVIMSADSNFHYNEKKNCRTYLNMMEEYVNKTSLRKN